MTVFREPGVRYKEAWECLEDRGGREAGPDITGT